MDLRCEIQVHPVTRPGRGVFVFRGDRFGGQFFFWDVFLVQRKVIKGARKTMTAHSDEHDMNLKPKHLFQSQSRQLAEAVAIIDHDQPQTHHFTEEGPTDLHDLNQPNI